MNAEVERPVVVAVTGTHSTGKSTFLARLAHELRRKKVTVATVADLGEQAQRIGLPILGSHTSASTLWIMTRGISNEIEAWVHSDVILVDRPVPDALAYYRAALEYRNEVPDPAVMLQLESLALGHAGRYDLLFRTTLDPSIPLGDNKNRDTDAVFRRLADRHVADVLAELGLVHEVLPVDGHDQALALAISVVDRHLAGEQSSH